MKTEEERLAWMYDSLFDGIYNQVMSVGGDGDALIKCRNRYGNSDAKFVADRFEKYLTEKHSYVKVERFRDENNKFIAYDGLEKGTYPFTRHEHEYEGIKGISFAMTPETGFTFRYGQDSTKTDDWNDIIVIL